jgi:2-keto-4-pentenoate hydratase/2-oxohepta-3-ene-1,7-dioic acid hydratase in catechol pathway
MVDPSRQDAVAAPLDSRRPWSLAGAPWGIISYVTSADDSPRAGAVTPDGTVVSLGDWGKGGVLSLLARWEEVREGLERFRPSAHAPVIDAQLDLVLRYPPKLLFAGANYHGHLAEMGVPEPASTVTPFFFLKPPTTALRAAGQTIRVRGESKRALDWEAELAVVIGRRATAVSAAEAMSYVAGYLPLNDISDRAALHRESSLAPPFSFDWLGAKGMDDSCPVGAAIIPGFHVPSPEDLRIRTWVNGEIKQNSTTRDMVYDIATLISAASHQVTLEPGDVIATGTPAGVGAPRGECLAVGDVVTIEIESVGAMRNRIEYGLSPA